MTPSESSNSVATEITQPINGPDTVEKSGSVLPDRLDDDAQTAFCSHCDSVRPVRAVYMHHTPQSIRCNHCNRVVKELSESLTPSILLIAVYLGTVAAILFDVFTPETF